MIGRVERIIYYSRYFEWNVILNESLNGIRREIKELVNPLSPLIMILYNIKIFIFIFSKHKDILPNIAPGFCREHFHKTVFFNRRSIMG